MSVRNSLLAILDAGPAQTTTQRDLPTEDAYRRDCAASRGDLAVPRHCWGRESAIR
jgi:hypothetical protein